MKYNDQVRADTVAIFKRYIKKEIDSGIDATNLDQIMMNIESSDQFTLDLMASLDRQRRDTIREASAERIAVAKAKDEVAKKEGRLQDVKYKGRAPHYDREKLRAAILATKGYPSLDKQLVAINNDYITATDAKLSAKSKEPVVLTRSALHREKQSMQLEGIL
jgi:DNA invertase Pin-like site-specific DNA recombinase